MAPASTAPSETVPGPADREAFFTAQARHRRDTWLLSALAAAALVPLGAGLGLVVAPVLVAPLVVLADLINLFTPVPDLLREAETPAELIAALIVLILTGLTALGLVVARVKPLLQRAPGTALAGLRAVPFNPEDPEERQLANLVEEMAVAAGIRPPRVMVHGQSRQNALLVGASTDDAVVVVSRNLLHPLDRDETSAVVGHLVASVANGDLLAARHVLWVYHSFAIVRALLVAPLGQETRELLRALMHLAAGPSGSHPDPRLAPGIIPALHRAVERDVENFQGDGTEGSTLGIRAVFYHAQHAVWTLEGWLVTLVLDPLLAFAWRSRRYLADATAVQLTRNPDALARALIHVAGAGSPIAAEPWLTYLTFAGREVRGYQERRLKRRHRAAKRGGHGPETLEEWQSVLKEMTRLTVAQDPDVGIQLVKPHPRIERRVHRVRAMGAAASLAYGGSARLGHGLGGRLLTLAGGALYLVVAVICFTAWLPVVFIGMVGYGLVLSFLLMVVHLVLRFALPGLLRLLG